MILNTIQEQTGFKIELLDNGIWNFYPFITYSNSNVNMTQKDNSLTVQNANIQINKSYWPLSPFVINLNAPTINYKGMEMRNTIIKAKYRSNIIHIISLTG